MLQTSMFVDVVDQREQAMFSEYVVRAVAQDHVERLRREAVADRLAHVAVRTPAERRPQRTAAGRLLRSIGPRQPQPCSC
jgi:hypothetical protein